MTSDIVPAIQPDDAVVWLDCMTRWLEGVERRRGSVRSRREYTKIVKEFFGFMEGRHPANVSGADCQRWVKALEDAGLSRNTIKTRLAAVSSFYSFACQKYEVVPGQYLHHFNPASVVERPHVNPYEKSKGLTPEAMRGLLRACDRETIIGCRDFAIIAFYAYTGRRRAEIARMTWADLRWESTVREYHYTGKGGKTAWRELPEPVWNAIDIYMKASGRAATLTPESPLFTATNEKAANLGHAVGPDQPIGERTVSDIIDRAAKRAGMEHISVHTLRHTAAKLRRKSGASIEEVSQFLDHSSIATTQIYLQSVEAKEDVRWRSVEALIGLSGD